MSYQRLWNQVFYDGIGVNIEISLGKIKFYVPIDLLKLLFL